MPNSVHKDFNVLGLTFWNVAHVAAAGQRRGVSQHIPSALASDWDEWTKVTPISDRTNFSANTLSLPTVKEIIRLSNSESRWTSEASVWWGMCHFVQQFDLQCRSQTEDIKTCSISPALPCPDRGLPVPNHERTKRVGDGNCGIAVITWALRILHFNPFFSHMLLLLSLCFYGLEWKFAGVKTRY